METKARRRWHNMLVAAMADSKLSPEENAYLEEARKELGLTTADAQQVVQDYKAKRGGIELSGTREERTNLLRDIIRATLADGRLDDRERRLLDRVAKHIGLSAAELESLIAACRDDSTVKSTSLSPLPDTPPTPSAPPEVVGKIHEKSGVEFIAVPAGTFLAGDMSVGGVVPKKRVNAFQIAKYPLTNAGWRRFVEATDYQGKEEYGEYFNAPSQPVVGVSIEDAIAYCEWAGVRLPTEVEWERTTRGTDGRKFAWGDSYPNKNNCCFGRSPFGSAEIGPLPVGSLPAGMSSVGCHDLTGNIDEWCDNGGPNGRDEYPLRGGNWLSAPYALNSYYHTRRVQGFRSNAIGFRVAL